MSQRRLHRQDHRLSGTGESTDTLRAAKSRKSDLSLAGVEAGDLLLKAAQGYSQFLLCRI